MKKIFVIIGMVAFLAAFIIHILTFASGAYLKSNFIIVPLFLLVFISFGYAIMQKRKRQKKTDKSFQDQQKISFSKLFFDGAPKYMIVLATFFFFYAILNFGLFMYYEANVGINNSDPMIDLKHQNRLMTGHLMAFSIISVVMIFSTISRD